MAPGFVTPSTSCPLCLLISSFCTRPLFPVTFSDQLDLNSTAKLTHNVLRGNTPTMQPPLSWWLPAAVMQYLSESVEKGRVFCLMASEVSVNVHLALLLACSDSMHHGNRAAHLMTVWRRKRWWEGMGRRKGEKKEREWRGGEERREDMIATSSSRSDLNCNSLANFLFQALLTS